MQDLAALLRDFKKAQGDVEQFIKKDLPRIIGTESVRIVRENFYNQSYDSGNGITKWPERKESTNKNYDRGRTANAKTGKLSKYRTGKNSTYKGSVYSSSKPLLRQTLALFNSIAYQIRGTSVFIGTNTNLIPYAVPHNEGTHHEPKRQYIPMPSQGGNIKIQKAIGKKIDYEISKRMRAFKK